MRHGADIDTARMKPPEIRPFRPAEWRQYRDLRLAALKDAPDAFGSTWAVNARLDDAAWRSRLQGLDPARDFPIAATADGVLGGMAWARIEADRPETAQLFQMWVAPPLRGRGIARQILQAAIAWSRYRGARIMDLGVTLGDSPARRLYESAGFTVNGEPEPLRDGSPLRIQPMTLILADD